jgi:hypothetical protein
MVRRLIIVSMSLPCALIWGAVPATASTGWVIQPTPRTVANSALVSVSCLSATVCTAVGQQAGPSQSGSVTLAERWNGTRWAVQPTPHPGAQGSSLSGVSCSSATSCTAVGTDTTSTGVTVTLAEHWNGTRWAVQPTPNPAPGITAVFYGVSCRSATACTAVGWYINNTPGGAGTLAEQWNGTRWAIQPTPNPTGAEQSVLQGVSCPSATSCTAAGSYFTPSGPPQTLAERWNGTTWAVQPTPNPTGASLTLLTGVSCSSATACTAVGWYGKAASQLSVAERWNGTRWAVQPTPNPTGAVDTILEAVSCRTATACTAVGISARPPAATLAEHWDGTAWVIQNTPTPVHAENSELSGVSCVAATTCTATGHYNYRSLRFVGKTLAEHEQESGGGRAIRNVHRVQH